MDMETSPTEITTHIMRFLSLEDRNSCSLVCKRWHFASEDPLFSSRLICRLCLFDDLDECFDVARYACRRLIGDMSIRDSWPNHDVSHSGVRYSKDRVFWINISNKFRMISTIHLDKLSHYELQKEVFVHIADFFTSVKTVKLCSSVLLKAIYYMPQLFYLITDLLRLDMMRTIKVNGQRRERYEKLLSALEKIPEFILIHQSSEDLKRLLDLYLNVHCRSIQNINLHISKNGYSIPLNLLKSFCGKSKCEIELGIVSVLLPRLTLTDVINELHGIPRLRINYLSVELTPSSAVGDIGFCLHQISMYHLTHLKFQFPCNVHDWLVHEIFSAAISNCRTLNLIECFGKFDKNILYQLFFCCPLTESVQASHSYVHELQVAKCTDIRVNFITAHNGYMKVFNLTDNIQSKAKMTMSFSELVLVLPSQLREFKIKVNSKLDDPTIFIKLNHQCPYIRALKITCRSNINTSINMGLFSKFKKWRELELVSCSPFTNTTMEMLSLSCLIQLRLLFCDSSITLTGDTFDEIVCDCQNLKSLDLSSWNGFQNTSLVQEALTIILKYLEELNLQLCENVNDETLDLLSRFAPTSLKTLTLSKKDALFTQKVKICEDKHPKVCVILC